MTFEGIVERAGAERPHPDEKKHTKVCVAGLTKDETADSVFGLFEGWAQGTGGEARIIRSGSFGYYDLEPIVVIENSGRSPILYRHVTAEVAELLLSDCLKAGRTGPDLAWHSVSDEGMEGIPRASEVPLVALQRRIALGNCGLVDPGDVGHYIAARHGYEGLATALRMGRAGVLEELKKACSVDPCNDAGFRADPWQSLPEAEGHGPDASGSGACNAVVCNGVDCDARALTGRLILDSDPHSVLEGLLIAAYGIGASLGIICVAAEDDLGRARLPKLVEQMKDYGLLGLDILGSGFDCEMEIRPVPRSLILCEDSALLCALEGRQTMPAVRDAFARPRRFGDKRRLVLDIESLAKVAAIFGRRAPRSSRTGPGPTTETKVITLSGDIVHPYTVEVPLGISLDCIINLMGGGIRDSAPLKAMRLGGPTAAYWGDHELDRVVGREALEAAGPHTGGVLEVVSGETCMVERTERLASYLHGESCGRCLFCREGTLQVADILRDIAAGDGSTQDLDFLINLAKAMKEGSLCPFGRNAGDPVVSSIGLFRSDYEAHLREKRCPKA